MTFKLNTETDTPKIQMLDGDEVIQEHELKPEKNYMARELVKLFNLDSYPIGIHKLCFEIFKYNRKKKAKGNVE